MRLLRGRADLTLVYSGSHKTARWSGERQAVRKLAFIAHRVLIWGLATVCGAKVRTVTDVNAPEFWGTVPAGSHGIVAGFNQIFRRQAIDSFRTLVNFHPSILPLYRGPVPSYWVLKNGEKQTGYTLHVITERIDSGGVLYQEAVPCAGISSGSELNLKIARAALGTLERYLTHVENGSQWQIVTLDAHSVYLVPVNYGRRPEVSA
jgi:methionyl-tRNA formyltransferase